MRYAYLKHWLVVGFLSAIALAQDPAAGAKDLLARAIGLIASQPAEAVKLLRQVVRLDPDLPGLRYQLGLALHAIGDEADAEVEFREAVRRTPDSAEAHNYLGIVRFHLGDLKGALEDFRAAIRLAPNDPNAHFNLAETLARGGDSAGGIAELKVAAGLAPSDSGLARLVGIAENAPAGTIKVDVRQVLVPVVVTDAQGHHVTGLTQADFRVFEDGVEQKIIAFSVERAGQPQTPTANNAVSAPGSEAAAASMSAPAPKPRRTYMIVIDTLHTSFNNLAAARQALLKLFAQERSVDSQYVVTSLGISPDMVINVTRDPSAVLAALENKRFQKLFLEGQVGGVRAEMDRFRRNLDETRYACDLAATDTALKGKCAAGVNQVSQQARQIEELDRTLTVGFLRQFRSLVAQLARARDRRTIVLISEGFQIEPGREAIALLNSYFPPSSHCLVPNGVYCPANQLESEGRMANEFEPILQLAAATNVMIDTIDSRGLYGQKAFDASTLATSAVVNGAVGRFERDMASADGNTLTEIAAATGGIAFHDSNDLLGGLQRAFADGRDYYTIAYVSGNANPDGKFRAITVQVRDRHAVVNAKRGYWTAAQ